MSLTKLLDNLNIIENLPDQPAMTSQELKQRFDESGNTIKKYLNQVLSAELDQIIAQLQNDKLDKRGGTVTGGLLVNGGVTGNLHGNCSGTAGSCIGNAGTASKLKNPVKIQLKGAVNGSSELDGSKAVEINTTQEIYEYDLFDYADYTYVSSALWFRNNLQKIGKLVNISFDGTFQTFSFTQKWIPVFTLPAVLRPNKAVAFVCGVSGIMRRGYIETDGRVLIQVSSNDSNSNFVFNCSYLTN